MCHFSHRCSGRWTAITPSSSMACITLCCMRSRAEQVRGRIANVHLSGGRTRCCQTSACSRQSILSADDYYYSSPESSVCRLPMTIGTHAIGGSGLFTSKNIHRQLQLIAKTCIVCPYCEHTSAPNERWRAPRHLLTAFTPHIRVLREGLERAKTFLTTNQPLGP